MSIVARYRVYLTLTADLKVIISLRLYFILHKDHVQDLRIFWG